MNMRVVIAGCGDLGLRVAQALLENPATEVWGIRRTIPHAQHGELKEKQHSADSDASHTVLTSPELAHTLHWIAADLSDATTLTKLPTDVTHIVFAAAPSQRSEQDYLATYLTGLKNIVHALASPSLKRVIFISSTAVYGEHGQDLVDETTPVAPKGFNGRILCEAEAWLAQLHRDTHIEALSLRLSGIYGPGRTYLLDRLRQGLAAAASQPEHWVNRIHIEDATAAVIHLLSYPHPEPVYLVTDSTPLPMRTLYEDLARIVGGPVPAEGNPPTGVGSKRLSNARLLATGFKFKWPDSRAGYASVVDL